MTVVYRGVPWFQKEIRKVDTPRPTQRYYFAGPFTNRNGAPAELMLQVYREAGTWKAESSEGSFLPELPRAAESLHWGLSCR